MKGERQFMRFDLQVGLNLNLRQWRKWFKFEHDYRLPPIVQNKDLIVQRLSAGAGRVFKGE